MVEYTSLENWHTVKGIWGSNPCLSAGKRLVLSISIPKVEQPVYGTGILPFSITVVRQFLVLLVVVRIHEGQLK